MYARLWSELNKKFLSLSKRLVKDGNRSGENSFGTNSELNTCKFIYFPLLNYLQISIDFLKVTELFSYSSQFTNTEEKALN